MSAPKIHLLPDELPSAIGDYLAGHGPESGDGRPWPETIAVDTDDLKSWHAAAIKARATMRRRVTHRYRQYLDRRGWRPRLLWRYM